MEQIGFIGMGNMGYAMLKGALKVWDCKSFYITDISQEKRQNTADELNVNAVDSNAGIVKNCKYIVLAIKPQFYGQVIEEIKKSVTKEHIIISIAPGITISDLKEMFETHTRIMRVMPNTPALVLEGMSAGCFSDDSFEEQEKEFLTRFFESFGEFEIIEERLISAFTSVSGSSPAYVYMFIEALADGGVRYGLPRDKAYKFAAQAVMGSAKMVLETKEHPGQLKDNVCSPGGTTIAAVAALEEEGFRNAVLKACDACFIKAENIK